MTSHVMDLTWLGQFQIITDLIYSEVDLVISHLTYLTFWLSDQPFESTFWINLRNQPSHWIGGATSLWYVTFSDKRMYVGECTPTYWGKYDLGS